MKNFFLFLMFFGSLLYSADVLSGRDKNDVVCLSSKKGKQKKMSKGNQRRNAKEKTIRYKKHGNESCCELVFLSLCVTVGAAAGNLMSSSMTKENTFLGGAAGFGAGAYFLNRKKSKKVKLD